MKYLIITFITFFLVNWTAPINNELPQFSVEYIYGCNVITKSQINVYIKENKYFAEHSSPTYFDGQKVVSLGTIKLNADLIESCFKFLNKAKSLPKKCERFSSSENHHIIIIGNDTIDIDGDCNWENLDFQFLDQNLFGEKHLEIVKKKDSFLIDLHKKLSGTWYMEPLKNKLKRDDIITFSKSNVTKNFIVFGEKNSLKGNCKTLLKMKNLKRYSTKISDGWNETVLNLSWGKVTLVNDYTKWYESEATFTLESITKDELKVKFLWSH